MKQNSLIKSTLMFNVLQKSACMQNSATVGRTDTTDYRPRIAAWQYKVGDPCTFVPPHCQDPRRTPIIYASDSVVRLRFSGFPPTNLLTYLQDHCQWLNISHCGALAMGGISVPPKIRPGKFLWSKNDVLMVIDLILHY